MAKKYVPSGYQIINIIIKDDGEGNLIVEDSEDKQLLVKLLSPIELQPNVKPILIRLEDIENSYTMVGFGTIMGSSLSLYNNGSEYVLSKNGNNIDVVFTE